MLDEDSKSEVRVEQIDADAVCANCGTVNPEDTLLCKTCGNNLRDQRARRVVSQHIAEMPALQGERVSFLKIALGILGILVIIWVAINIGKIEDFMAGVQAPATSNASVYWSGSDSATFDAMRAELDSNPLTPQQTDLARQEPVNDGVIEGRYVLIGNNPGNKRMTVGQAIVRKADDRFLFVALVAAGKGEIRGEAKLEGTTRYVARESAGLKLGDDYFDASGFAQKAAAGGFECYGLSTWSDENYAILAYRIH